MKAYVSKNQLDEDEQALVSILASKCRDSGDLHAMLKRLFAGGVALWSQKRIQVIIKELANIDVWIIY